MRSSIAVTAALLIVLASSTAVAASENSVFEAELHHFSPPVGTCVGGVCEFESHGYGFTNLMGAVTVDAELTWDFTTTPCTTLGPLVFTLVGATGSVTISGSGLVCDGLGPSGFPEFISTVGQVTGGTGEFSGILGNVSADGILAKRGPVVHMSGTVSR